MTANSLFSESLFVSQERHLPLETVTETVAIMGRRGSGKTHTGKVMAEEMISHGLVVGIIDLVGVWWGLRSGAQEGQDGLPVVIFGGKYQDLPLQPTSGRTLADIFVQGRFCAIFDLSLLSREETLVWIADFGEQVYLLNSEPLHLIMDEADYYAPQTPNEKGEQRSLKAVDTLVRRGRARGLGMTLITQRPASLHKNVLGQAELLLVLQMAGVRDVKAVDEWVRLHADEDEARKVKASLPSLERGTAWLWSPSWLKVLELIHVRAAHTFDSSATPRIGQVSAVPRQLKEIDIAALGERLAAQLKDDQDADPAVLRKRIAQLQEQLASTPRRETIREVFVPVETILPVEIDALETRVQVLKREVVEECDSILRLLQPWKERARSNAPSEAPLPDQSLRNSGQDEDLTLQEEDEVLTEPEGGAVATDAHREKLGGAPLLAKSQQTSLDHLLAFERLGVSEVAHANLAILLREHPKSPDAQQVLKKLLNLGLIEYPRPGYAALTQEGRARAVLSADTVSLESLHRAWTHFLPVVQSNMVRVLVRKHPTPIPRGLLIKLSGQQPGGGFNKHLNELVDVGVVARPCAGKYVATEVLFPVGLPRSD